MNFIDISSWQSNISLPKVFEQNQLDGVIVKATEGTAYVNPKYSEWVKWLNTNGKLFGVYHFCTGADAEAEAKHFYNCVKGYIGRGVPVADYEDPATNKGTAWLKKFLDKFYALSGIRCMVYCSLSVVQSQDFKAIAANGHPLWVAQYADMAVVYGFVENPWQKGSVAPFSRYVMHQYTGNGRLNGYSGALDLDKYYGTADEWHKMADNGEEPEPVPEPTPAPNPMYKPTDPSVVLDVLKGKYGIGTDRVIALREAGYDPNNVQKKVNHLYSIAGKVKKDIGSDLDYINSILWIVRSL